MGGGRQTKAQLLVELNELRLRVTTLEAIIAQQQLVKEGGASPKHLSPTVLPDTATQRPTALALPQSELFYQTVLGHIQDGVFLVQHGLITFVNTAGSQIVRAKGESILGKPFLSFVAPESSGRIAEGFSAYERTGQIALQSEITLLGHNSDQRLIVQIQMVDVSIPPQRAMLIIVRDISAHRRAETAIKEEAEIATALARVGQALLASLETPLVLDRLCRMTTELLRCDCSYTMLWEPQYNALITVVGYGDAPEQENTVRALAFPAFLLGKTENEELERETGESNSPVNWPELTALFQSVGILSVLFFPFRRGSEVFGALIMGYRKQQSFSARQERLARGIAQLASFALTNAKLLEELESSNRIKEDFVGTMSHELRTPLHILYGYIELLQDETFSPLTPQQRDIVKRIEHNVQALTTLINTTLDLSRLQTRQVPLLMQEAHVPELLAELVGEIRPLNPSTAVVIEWSCSADIPVLWTDVGKLKIILKNILTNALKFTEQGRIAIVVAPQRAGVTFTVSDTGSGIAAEVLPFIFEPFRQGGTFATRKHGGVGLGLYIVRRLLELLGGTVTVESEVGKGSTFQVWIPIHAQSGK